MTRGRAALAISQGVSVWLLEAPDGFGEAGFHAHHAIQITASLSGSLTLATREHSRSGTVLAVRAGAAHRLEAHGLLAFVFVEPESRIGRALTQSLFGTADIVPLPDEVRAVFAPDAEHLLERADRPAMLARGEAAIRLMEPGLPAVEPDPRIRRILDTATARLDQPLSLKQAAEGIYLSESRLRHLFVEQTGLPFKTYLLWLRLVRALDLYSEGQSLTEAAHLAGFSDSAHLSRIFRRTFGLPATTLTRIQPLRSSAG